MMDEKTYWELTEEERNEQDKIDSKDMIPKERYYLWNYCRSYGWRATGLLEGYETLDLLKNDSTYEFGIKDGDVIQILRSKPIEGDKE